MKAALGAEFRVLRGTSATVPFSFLDQEGGATAAAGAVTVDVARADGTSVHTALSTTASGNVYTVTLDTTATGLLDVLDLTWKDGGTARGACRVEVVGGYFFSVAEARAFDQSLQSASNYTDAQILAARREVEDECERITGVAWVPRFARELIHQPGRAGTLRTSWPQVRALRDVRYYTTPTTYKALTSTELGNVSWNGTAVYIVGAGFPWGIEDMTIDYEHGNDRPPADLRHAALTRLRSVLNRERSGMPSNATSYVPAGGGATFSLAQPGRAGFETGLPEVDATYQRYSLRVPGLA